MAGVAAPGGSSIATLLQHFNVVGVDGASGYFSGSTVITTSPTASGFLSTTQVRALLQMLGWANTTLSATDIPW